MGRFAVIDIGTNSTKMFIGRIIHGRLSQLDDKLEITRLGEGLSESGELEPGAIMRTVAAVEAMVRHAESLGVDTIRAVGTEALRRAANREELTDLLKRRCKLKIDIISSDQEAEYALEAVRSALDIANGKTVIFDIGGGSTEIIELQDRRLMKIESLPLGVRILADEFRIEKKISPEISEAMALRIRRAVGPFRGHADRLIGLGGTFSALGALDLRLQAFDAEKVNGRILGRDDLEFLGRKVSALAVEGRCRLPGMSPDRADIIPAGAAIALELMISHEAYETTICGRGLRHGLFIKEFVSVG